MEEITKCFIYIMISVHIMYKFFLSFPEICIFFYLTRLPLHNTVNSLLLGIYERTAVFQFSESAGCARKLTETQFACHFHSSQLLHISILFQSQMFLI